MKEHFDLLIRNATVIDGTAAPRLRADIGVRAEHIARIGRLDAATAETEIDASGKVAAPGFIDAHTHDDRLMLSGADMAPKVSQGVTTVIAGNCGISLGPLPEGMKGTVPQPLDLLDETGAWFRFPTFGAYVEELRARPAATNCALLVGHTTLRVATMNRFDRPASDAEIGRMRSLAREALAAGAIGVSTGLYYEPANAAPTEEVIEVCRPLKEHNGIYCTHMRNEADQVLDALDEAFRIGRALDVPVVISHHKVVGLPNHGRSRQTLPRIAEAMRHQPVCLDCYPYVASSTILSASRAKICSRVIVSSSRPYPQFSGMDLDEVVRHMGLPYEEAIRKLQPASAIYFSMDEADVQRILSFEHTMVGSDGLPHDLAPHPRLWGTFPRVLGHYCRELGLFPLEIAVWKMTGLPARTFGLKDRGVLKEGAFADIALFDPETVDETATWEKPAQPARGILATIVNGALVWSEGRATGSRPGWVLRRT
ncbi:MAG TPA: D-aminoacylase [Burkholderiales bacterium]|jgi:N-acyl-D-amino-acid deacylase|nr:D-aminoacylase [Burkholderiales bacterium]